MIFLYGFSKNERDSVSSKELDAFKTLSKDYLALSQSQIEHAEATGILIELEDSNAQQDQEGDLRIGTRHGWRWFRHLIHCQGTA